MRLLAAPNYKFLNSSWWYRGFNPATIGLQVRRFTDWDNLAAGSRRAAFNFIRFKLHTRNPNPFVHRFNRSLQKKSTTIVSKGLRVKVARLHRSRGTCCKMRQKYGHRKRVRDERWLTTHNFITVTERRKMMTPHGSYSFRNRTRFARLHTLCTFSR